MRKIYLTIVIVFLAVLQLIVGTYFINELVCCLVFLVGVFCRKKKDSFSIFDIFLITEFLFCYDVIFGDIFGIYDLHSFDHFGQLHFFNDLELVTSFKAFTMFQSGICLSWLWSKNYEMVPIEQRVVFSDSIRKLCLIMFYILFIPAIVSKLILVYSAFVYGYVESIQLGELVSSNVYVYLGASLFEVTSAFCLYLTVDEKQFKRIAILYALPTVLLLFTGQRGPGIVIILALLWLYNKYIKKINLKYILTFGALAIILMPLIGHWRGDSVDVQYNGVWGWISRFFLSQGMSFNVVPFTVRCLEEFTNEIPFLFGYFTDLFHPAEAYTIDAINNNNYLAYHLSYHIYGNTFFYGHTMGTSLIAELYELVGGRIALIFPLSFLIMKLTIYFSNNMYKNPLIFVVGIKYLTCFIYSPRDSVGKVCSFTIVYTIIFTLIMYLLFKKKYA